MSSRTISVHVSALPPTKAEALSIFNERHPHNARAKPLLSAAADALAEANWNADTTADLKRELRVSGARPASDATNILGGIGDVLEDKNHRSGTELLGDLAAVHLFRNDRQIREIGYRWEPSESNSYSVTLTELSSATDEVAD